MEELHYNLSPPPFLELNILTSMRSDRRMDQQANQRWSPGSLEETRVSESGMEARLISERVGT
jgi:hypothetical protein